MTFAVNIWIIILTCESILFIFELSRNNELPIHIWVADHFYNLYSVDWWKRKESFEWSLNGSCHFCHFPFDPVKKELANSEKNDFLIGCILSTDINLINFISTYRGCGGKATVVILIDDRAYNQIEEVVFETYKNCGGFIINIGKYQIYSKPHIFASKLQICHDFIWRYQSVMNRVIVIDISDIIFQGDPFNNMIEKGVISFVGEHLPFGLSWWTRKIHKLKGIHYSNYHLKPVINGGTYGSDVQTVIRYLETFNLLYSVDYYTTIDQDDQAYMNVLVYEGYLDNFNIKWKIIEEHEGYVIILKTPGVIKALISSKFGEIQTSFARDKPIIIHQYDRHCEIVKTFYETCPRHPNISWEKSTRLIKKNCRKYKKYKVQTN